MFLEIKVKVTRIIDDKTRKRTETYIIPRCEVFAEAEHTVISTLIAQQQEGTLQEFEIQSIRISPIKEVFTQYEGNALFMAVLTDLFIAEDGTEKPLRYKVLLPSYALQDAMNNLYEISRQGYQMAVEGVTETDYKYLEHYEQTAES